MGEAADRSDGGAGARKTGWAFRAALAVAAGGLVLAFIGLSPSCSRLDEGPAGIAALATGPMERFKAAGSDAPAQTELPFFDADGAERRFADFRGRVVVVNFWATWCAPCVKEMPTLAALQRAVPKDEIVVLAISADRTSDRDKAKAQLAELTGGALDFHHDPGLKVTLAATRQGALPTTIVYDRQGVEVGRLIGDADWGSPEAVALIEAVRARQ